MINNSIICLNQDQTALMINIIKIAIIVFLTISLFGSIKPFYEGKDAYIHGIASVRLAEGNLERQNSLLLESGHNELVGSRWLLTDFNTAIPRLPGIGIAAIGAFSYVIGGYMGLFYIIPFMTIIFLITTERIATNLFGRNVGLFTLSLVASSNLLFRNSVSLQTESIFSLFFILGAYFLIKFFRKKNEFWILLTSIFFVVSSTFRLQGLVSFPVEIIVMIFVLIIYVLKRNRDVNNNLKFKKRKIILIFSYCLIPWILFFSSYMIYNDYYFGNALTNYGEVSENTSYDMSISSLYEIEKEDLENFKQYSKYLLPYQITAIYNSQENFDEYLGKNWLGIGGLLILFFGVLISFKMKKNRIDLIIFLLLTLSTVWFYSSITTAERAESGVPGRYMIPVFVFNIMILGFMFKEFLKLDWQNKEKWKYYTIKTLKSITVFGIIIFLITSFYFSSSSQFLKDGANFKKPDEISSRYPLDLDGLNSQSVIFSMRTDYAVEYNVIAFTPDPRNVEKSFIILKEILENDYEVFTIKNSYWNGEKEVIKKLVENKEFSIIQHSNNFCKIFLDNEKQRVDKLCIE